MSMHPTRNLFKEFKGNNRVFVETGSYRGDGIQLAIDAGYEVIISMDIDPANIAFCKSRFNILKSGGMVSQEIRQEVGGAIMRPVLTLVVGDSATDLWNVFDWFSARDGVTYWLDAHAQHLENEPEYENPFPLLQELRQISQAENSAEHPPVIMIDDILHLTHPDVTGWKREDIERHLRKINYEFWIHYFPNPVKNNILVAHL